jgi:hypothetical protein
MSGKMASIDPGLCPYKGELLVPCSRARARNQFSILSLSTTRTTPPCQTVVIHPTRNLINDIVNIGHQGRLKSRLLLNRNAP